VSQFTHNDVFNHFFYLSNIFGQINQGRGEGTWDMIGGKHKNYGWNIEGEGTYDLETEDNIEVGLIVSHFMVRIHTPYRQHQKVSSVLRH
jgi:hypothetical protein